MGTERVPVKYKKATAPLDETARERLWASAPLLYGEETAELADLVDSFYEGTRGDERDWSNGPGFGFGFGFGFGVGVGVGSGGRESGEMLEAVLSESGADPVAERVRAAVEEVARVIGLGMDEVKRRVMERLRDEGFDAGLCKSQWDRTSRRPAGYHDYIDIVASNGTRYILEINLAAEFEIARPTDRYQSLLRTIPKVLVAKPEILRRLINVMCIAAKESIKSAGMHIPPWRTREYMQEKWFSSYKRTAIASRGVVRTGGAATPMSLSSRKFCRMEIAGWKGARNGKVAVAFRGM